MVEPISTLFAVGLAGGAAGGVGKQVTEMALSSAAKWIKAKYQDHIPEVAAKAEQNSNEFLNTLGLKVAALEQESEITKGLMNSNMSEPSFGALLQKAVLASSQTDNAQKHDILSDLVSQRLKAHSESIYTVTSQLAVDAIAHVTPNQLRILGLVATLVFLSPAKQEHSSREEYEKYCGRWLIRRIAPYQGLLVGPLDFAYLQSTSCATTEIGVATFGNEDDDLTQLLRRKFAFGNFTLPQKFLESLPVVGTHVRYLWDGQSIGSLSLTTTGRLIGTLVSDRNCGDEMTSFEDWQTQGAGKSSYPPVAMIKAITDAFE